MIEIAVPATNAGVAVAVPPLAIGKIPVTPLVKTKPVQLVRTPEVGVPKSGETSVGDVARTALPDPVTAISSMAPVPAVARPSIFAVAIVSPEVVMAPGAT